MKYKAIMLDVDGTLVPYDYYSLPSNKVADTIKKLQGKVAVCLVTGRSYGFSIEILKKLSLHSGYAVVNNGSQVINLSTKELVYDQPIEKDDIGYIVDVLHDEKVPFYLKQEILGLEYQREHFKKGQEIKIPYMVYTDEILSSETADKISGRISRLPKVTISKGRHKKPDSYSVSITHVNATKLHGIQAIIKEMNISKEEIIGVGDGNNDLPLLQASGLKVAMGNGIDELKAIADFIAPSVNEDGVAAVIEKFILQ